MNQKKKPAYDRGDALTHDLNLFLKQVTGSKKDFHFNKHNLVQLKRILSATNNLLTLATTLSAMKWLRKHFRISEIDNREEVATIKATKPNTNGFDIVLRKHKIIAEVKSMLPLHDGYEYGAGQVNGILDDAIKLQTGKKGIRNTKDYYKFIFLAKVPKKTEQAIEKLLEPWEMKSRAEVRVRRHKIKNKLKFLKKLGSIKTLDKDTIYIVEV